VSQVALSVNGELMEVPAGSTIADVVRQVTGTGDGKGIAVALDRVVVPRSAWPSTPAETGVRIEIVTAAAGG
jgi:sulfur carrier protein